MTGKTASERSDTNLPEVEVAETHSGEHFQVVAIHEGKLYKIVETDPDDESGYSYQISRSFFFQWASQQDIIWCRRMYIMFKVSDPKQSGKIS